MNIQDPNYFLGEGEFTRRDEIIKKLASSLKYSDPFTEIRNYIHGVMDDRSSDPKTFRRRTASEIIQDNYETGCTDRALVFSVLMREKGIPARYVETLDERWINCQMPIRPIAGHIFVDLFINGSWRIYDPFLGEENKYTINNRIYLPVGRGLDFSELDSIPEGTQNTNTLLNFRKI